MWQRFSERARKVVFYAQQEALKFGEGYVSTEHLLLGLLREDDSVAARVLGQLGLTPNEVREEVEKLLPRGSERPEQDMSLTPRAKRVIDLAYDEARNLGNDYIGTEHLLLGLVREGDGLAGRVLRKLGVELERARREVLVAQKRDPESVVKLPTDWSRPHQSHVTPFLTSVLGYASWEAEMFDGASEVGVQHVLLGLLRLEECLGARLLARCGVDLSELRDELDTGRSHRERPSKVRLSYDGEASRILDSARDSKGEGEALGTEDVVLAILKSEGCKWSRVLGDKFGVSAEYYEKVVRRFYEEEPGPGGG